METCEERQRISFWKGVLDRKRLWVYVSAHMGARDCFGGEATSVNIVHRRRVRGFLSADMRVRPESGSDEGFRGEEESDLALMVRDFVEKGSEGAESGVYGDSDYLDFSKCIKKIHSLRHLNDQFERDLSEEIFSILPSVGEIGGQYVKARPCGSCCIRWSLVKLLRLAGYDAGICISKWQGSTNVPGGCHEYIDVVSSGNGERVIVDIDFRSHFEIARAVPSYNAVLNTLPVIYIGTFSRMKRILKVMAGAAKSSLRQNSMPFPPWRSLAYLQSKWQSACERQCNPDVHNSLNSCLNHRDCAEHLRHLKRYCKSRFR